MSDTAIRLRSVTMAAMLTSIIDPRTAAVVFVGPPKAPIGDVALPVALVALALVGHNDRYLFVLLASSALPCVGRATRSVRDYLRERREYAAAVAQVAAAFSKIGLSL